MSRQNLSARNIGSVMPPASGQTDFWDTTLPGFGCRVTARGTRTWVLLFRSPADRRIRRAKLGRYPAMSLGAAREKARSYLHEIQQGTDPLDAKQEDLDALTFKDLAQRYLDEYAKTSKRSWKKDRRA